MRAVNVSVGHDNDAVVAELFWVTVLAGATTQRQRKIGYLLIGADFVSGGAGNVQDLAADRQNCLALAVARLFGAATRRIALDDKQLGLAVTFTAAIGKLAGQPQLLCIGRGLALDLALLLVLSP